MKKFIRLLAAVLLFAMCLIPTAMAADLPEVISDVGLDLQDVIDEVRSSDSFSPDFIAGLLEKLDTGMLVDELKLIFTDTRGMTDTELAQKIRDTAAAYDVTLSDAQVTQLMSLCREMEGLSDLELREKLDSMKAAAAKVQNTIESIRETGEKVQETARNISGLWKDVRGFFGRVGNFFAGLFSR